MKPIALLLLALVVLSAQTPNPTQQPSAQPNPQAPVETGQPRPIFRVTVVSRSINAINYNHRSGTTRIDFRGTELMPRARGEADVNSQMGSTKIEVHVDRLTPADQFGPEYLTYVLWAITPEGRAQNLGELALSGDHSSLLATSSLQAFGLIVTAEPYFAVTQPSDVVVMENFVRKDTTGTIEQVQAQYELLKRGQYVLDRAAYKPVRINPKGPLQLAEAENAVEIARLARANQYAADTFQKASVDLQNAEAFMSHGGGKRVETEAREAAQTAEDARIITYRKIQDEERAQERQAREEQLARERAAAQQAQAAAQTADAQRAAAEQAQQQAQAAAEQAAQEKAAADAARAAALQQQQEAQIEAERARQQAAQADAQRQQAEAERAQLRERLKQQLNSVLETRETARGLIVNINDVLFDFNRYTLKPGAREKMAKVSGILLAYPGLKLQLEGYTDSVGSDAYNLKLSQERADAVREFLVEQGVSADNVTSEGLGKADPVASNDSASGRQQNRRVELIVSGEAIGTQAGDSSSVR